MTFGIRGNNYRTELPQIAYSLIEDLNQKNIKYLIDKKLSSLIQQKLKHKIPAKYQAYNGKLVKDSDFIISIGGDGTFLSTAKLVNNRSTPIIGVNLGKLGFLAETSVEQLSKFISNILKKKHKIEERTVLQAWSDRAKSKKIFGLNEIVIRQSRIVRTIEIQVFFNKQLVISYLADGLIVSTPTGSTGYALSSGGPIVNPKSNVIVLAPMYPHTLTARHVILPDNGSIKIKVISKVPIDVTSDGNNSFFLRSPAEIDIVKAPFTIKIAKRLDSNYFQVLNQKLLWGEDVRKNQKQ
jgi:NAD+ kinase